MGMRCTRASGTLGAFVEGVDVRRLVAHAGSLESDDAGAWLREAVHRYDVVFLRDQDLTADEFGRFARMFGDVLPHPAYDTAVTDGDVQILESLPDKPSKIELWHSDMTFSRTPPSFTLLHALVVPEFGGDTLWASAVAAYEGLSAPMRTLLDGLVAEHDFRHGFRESLAEPGGEARLADAIADNPPVLHPLVRTHPETGRKGVYVNPLFTTRIDGVSALESARLLAFLHEHVTRAEFTVRLGWQPGTLAIWDNCTTQHKPVNDFFGQHRRMHRVTIRGDVPH